MKKKCGIATVYTGYNYGSALQAYATKYICKGLDYEADVIKIRGLSQNRDIRLRKLLAIFARIIRDPKKIKKLKAYSKSKICEETKELFSYFYRNNINPVSYSYRDLKKACRKNKYDFFICGSDQIWNSTIDYVDPFLYLRFISEDKRIAFAPSFGRDYISKDNIRTISKYVNEIPYLSIREESGKNLIKKYMDRNAEVLVDPTLVLSKTEWQKALKLKVKKNNTAVLYFLDEPNDKTKKMIMEYCKEQNIKPIMVLNNFHIDIDSLFLNVGPKEFVELILNCKHVFTDSYHGMIFSANFNTDFTIFAREYNGATKQNARIDSFLKLIDSKFLFDPHSREDLLAKPDYRKINNVLENERKRSVSYLKNAIAGVIEK